MTMFESTMNSVFGTTVLYGKVTLVNRDWVLRLKVEGTDLDMDNEVYRGIDATPATLHLVTVNSKKECITDAFVANDNGVKIEWNHARLARSSFHEETDTHDACLEIIVEVA